MRGSRSRARPESVTKRSWHNAQVTPTARKLLDLLGADGASGTAAHAQALPLHAWEEIIALALSHGVAPLLHRSLQASGGLAAISEPMRTRLNDERRATAFANLRRCAVFRDIALAFAQRDIPLIALKGLHLAELVYRDISLRPMDDVDILVPRAEVGKAVATLQRMGYGPEEEMSSSAEALLDFSHAVALEHRGLGILIELHWTLVKQGYGYEPPMEDIWRTAVPGKLADAEVPLMSPEFLLLHVCAHLACHHSFLLELRALCDIAEIVRAGILAVPHGQIEAARALGLGNQQVLTMVVLPQALRVIIPPLGNQYLNLAKNSSLALAIAFSDIYAVMYTVINQTGQSITGILIIMLSYLVLSLTIAGVMNWINRRFQLVTR